MSTGPNCDFYGKVLIPPTVVEHQRAPLELATVQLREGEHPHHSPKDEPIPAAQRADDTVRVLWYKSIHGVPPCGQMLWHNSIHLTSGGSPIFPFACGYAALGLRKGIRNEPESDDCSVRIDGKVRHLRMEGNHMDGGLIGIRLRQVHDLLVRNNHIQAHSSVGIVVADAAMDVHLDGNRLHDNNINVRFQRLNCGDRRRVFVYRNRLSQPPDVGTHIYCRAMTEREGYPDAEVTLYHNTFRNGSRGFTVPHARRMPRGVPEFRLFNVPASTVVMRMDQHRQHVRNQITVNGYESRSRGHGARVFAHFRF